MLKSRTAGITTTELLLIVVILCAVMALLVPVLVNWPHRGGRGGAKTIVQASNLRQIGLASLLYGNSNDDKMPLSLNGWMSRLQDRNDKQLTIACPGPGTQKGPAPDAGGARPTRTWVETLRPFTKSLSVYIDPQRGDVPEVFVAPPMAVGDLGYGQTNNTYRNQGRFPMFGINYMFLAPMRIPQAYRNAPYPANYAQGEARSFNQATEPAATVLIVPSQRSLADPKTGLFIVNAPGMWRAYSRNAQGYVAFWGTTAGSGDWVGTDTACAEAKAPCPNPTRSHGSASVKRDGLPDGSNAVFLDSHVQWLKPNRLAAGTDFTTATAKPDGSGAVITDKSKYIWNLDGEFYGA